MAETTVPYKGTPREGAIFTLDLGSKTGWALHQADGTITSGTVEFKRLGRPEREMVKHLAQNLFGSQAVKEVAHGR